MSHFVQHHGRGHRIRRSREHGSDSQRANDQIGYGVKASASKPVAVAVIWFAPCAGPKVQTVCPSPSAPVTAVAGATPPPPPPQLVRPSANATVSGSSLFRSLLADRVVKEGDGWVVR